MLATLSNKFTSVTNLQASRLRVDDDIKVCSQYYTSQIHLASLNARYRVELQRLRVSRAVFVRLHEQYSTTPILYIHTTTMPPVRRGQGGRTSGARVHLQPPDARSMVRYLKGQCANKTRVSIMKHKETRGKPRSHMVAEYTTFVRQNYLPGLEPGRGEVEMSPKLAESCGIKKLLKELADPENYLPDDITTTARTLYNNFERRGWTSTQLTPAARRPPQDGYPPEDHPIFGRDGIMDGLLIGAKGPRHVIDSRRIVRNAEVYGHNGLAPGFWGPYRRNLILHGAHLQHQRGIAGDESQGAYSIVVSGQYEDVDVDEGNVIYYSGEGAQGKKSSKSIDRKSNRAMNASIRTRNPVRVLRAAKKGSQYAPPCGYRYDGLYECVGKETRLNAAGAFYERFKLVRLERDDQPELDFLVRNSPTAQEIADFGRIKDGY